MYLEVKQWPESQEVMDNPDWFLVAGATDQLGNSAYARILTEDDLEELAEKHFNPDREYYNEKDDQTDGDSITFGGGDLHDMP